MENRDASQFSEQPFRLGQYLVDPPSGTIDRDGEAIQLNNKSLLVLLCLADRAPDIASRQELLDQVWPDVFVTDAVLTTAIWELRNKLEDGEDEAQLIQTVRGKGYRLLIEPQASAEWAAESSDSFSPAAVSPTASERESSSTEEAADSSPRLSRRRFWLSSVAVSLLAAVVLVFLFGFFSSDSPDPGLPRRAYLQGAKIMRQFPGRVEEAMEWFRFALRLDPDYTPAQTGIAKAAAEQPRTEAKKSEGMAAANSAVAAEPDDPRKRKTRARLTALYMRDYEKAEADINHGLEKDPEWMEGYLRRAQLQIALGRYDEARESIAEAMEFDLPVRNLVNAYELLYFARSFDRAAKGIEETQDGDFRYKHFSHIEISGAVAMMFLGETERALEIGQRILAESEEVHMAGSLGFLLGSLGDRDGAQKMLDYLLANPDPDRYDLALVYVGLGEDAAALEQMEKAVRGRTNSFLRIFWDPALEELVNSPQFEELLRSEESRNGSRSERTR